MVQRLVQRIAVVGKLVPYELASYDRGSLAASGLNMPCHPNYGASRYSRLELEPDYPPCIFFWFMSFSRNYSPCVAIGTQRQLG